MGSAPIDGYYEVKTAQWEDAHRWSPAPRFRRKIILDLLQGLCFESVLEIGCAQPYLLLEIDRQFPGKTLAGVDIAASVIAQNRRQHPYIEFTCADIQHAPLGGQYDVVICSEVLEHLPDYELALDNIRTACQGYLLVTVPSSPLFPIDRHVGHIRHFTGQTMEHALRRCGFTVARSWDWGFPFHTFYKLTINKINPEGVVRAFSESAYDWRKKLVSSIIYGLFSLNLYRFGWQKIILAKV